MKAIVSALALVFAFSATAAPVKIDFSLSSSAEWMALWYPDASSSAGVACSIQVDRPMGKAAARASAENRVTCATTADDQAWIMPLGTSKVEQWGTHLEKYSFSVTGPFAETLFQSFRKKTADLSENGKSSPSSWSKIVLCGPDGATCTTDYFLDVDPSADSAAQIACGQTTDLLRTPQKIAADAATLSRSDYYEYMIQKQIENQDRKVSETHCTFIH
jgi:hypothetical protein